MDADRRAAPAPRGGGGMSARRMLAALLVVLVAVSSGYAVPAAADSAGTVFLQTVPALAGVPVAVGSEVVTTGGDGSAAIRVSDLNGIAASVHLADDRPDADTLLSVSKVHTAPHVRPHESHISIGLDITSRVRLAVGAGDTGVAPDIVRALRLHSVAGQVMDVDPRTTPVVWLLARRTRLVANVLTTQQVTWSVDRVTAPGVALTTAKPRFDPYPNRVWDLELQTVHGTVQIVTVPATAGVQFLLDGAIVSTGADGAVNAPVSDLNAVDQRMSLATHAAGAASVSVLRISRLTPLTVHERRVLVSLSVRRQVALRFVDLQGQPVDPERISEVRLDGGGGIIRLDAAEVADPVSLVAKRATQIADVWQSRPVTYSASVVLLDGSNAVFRGKQRFDPNSSDVWPIRLSVFRLTMTAHDVLFGSRVSSRVSVTRPNGTSYTVRLGSGDGTVLTSMVRGLYDMKIHDAVVGAATTVLVSRDDAVDVRVVTPLDAAVIAIVGMLLVVAAVWGGRRLARRRGGRASAEAAP
jgi:hypothetical protein